MGEDARSLYQVAYDVLRELCLDENQPEEVRLAAAQTILQHQEPTTLYHDEYGGTWVVPFPPEGMPTRGSSVKQWFDSLPSSMKRRKA